MTIVSHKEQVGIARAIDAIATVMLAMPKSLTVQEYLDLDLVARDFIAVASRHLSKDLQELIVVRVRD